MMRSKVRPGKDRKVFSRTAGATKRAQVSVLQSQADANTAKAAKDYQDIAESKERVGIYAPQAQSYGSSAEIIVTGKQIGRAHV